LVGEAEASVPAAEVFLLHVGRVVTLEDKIEFLLVGAVAAVVQQKMLIEFRNGVASRLFVQCDIALCTGRLLFRKCFNAVQGTGSLAGFVEQKLICLEKILLLQTFRQAQLLLS